MALFIDPLALQLSVLGITGILLFYLTFRVLMHVRRGEGIGSVLQGVWLPLLFTGIYAFVTGMWGQLTWPLPSSYNILFYDPYTVFGIILMTFSLLFRFNYKLEYAGFATLIFGAVTMYYGNAGFAAGMTKEPGVLLALYAIWGLAGVVTYPFALFLDRAKVAEPSPIPQTTPPLIHAAGGVGRIGGHVGSSSLVLILPMVIFLVAGLLALYIGVNAVPGHLVGFAKWTP